MTEQDGGAAAGRFWRRWIAGAIAIGVAAMTLADAALAWDGAYYLFRILDDGAPFIVFRRYGVLPIQAPAWIALELGAGIDAVRTAFSFGHAAVPAAALALCWWIVRREAPRLFLWPVVGIGLVTLPGQLFLVSEAIQTAQLAWPVFLWLILGAPRRGRILCGVLVLLLLVLHPAASIVLGGAGALGVAVGRRLGLRPISITAAILIALALLRAALLLSGWWEAKGIEHAGYALHFKQAVRGLPLVALLLGYAGAALLLARTRDPRRERIGIALAVGACAVLLVWAAQPSAWSRALGYRSWGPPFTVFAFALAAIDVLLQRRTIDARPRWRYAGIVASTFATVLVVQSVHWSRLDALVRAESSVGGCRVVDELPGAKETALAHWGIASHSLLVQGIRPATVIVHDAIRCSPQELQRGLRLTSSYVRDRHARGFFDLSRTGLPPSPATESVATGP